MPIRKLNKDSRYVQGIRVTRNSSKTVPSGHLGQFDIPAGQITFHPNLPNVENLRNVNFRKLY